MNTIDTISLYLIIGIGGTVLLDIWSYLAQQVFGVPATNWAMVGRWVGNFFSGRWTLLHPQSRKIGKETLIGWATHYLIGMAYGLPLYWFWGYEWLQSPSLSAPLIVSWVLLIAPFFIMMPGLGAGFAGSKTPNPHSTRLKSIAGHTVFALGMYLVATLLSRFY